MKSDPLDKTSKLSKLPFAPKLAVVGGGLAGCVAAHALLLEFPDMEIDLYDKAQELCGNHTWCLHAKDIHPESESWLMPLLQYKWSGYSVQFPKLQRHFSSPYYGISSDHLAQKTHALSLNYKLKIILQTPVAIINTTSIQVRDDTKKYDLVINASGWRPQVSVSGYQKFMGLEILCSTPHQVETPILMDVLVEQVDGFRFVYVLPLTENSLLVEDTYYSNSTNLNLDTLRSGILNYAAQKKWYLQQIIREETGCLPLPYFEASTEPKTWSLGPSGDSFQPVTGYSFPQILQSIAELKICLRRFRDQGLTTDLLGDFCLQKFLGSQKNRRKTHGFYFLLNRMMFLAATPSKRYKVLERFYTLPVPTIERFYAGQSNAWDRLRLLSGKPPVPLLKAVQAVFRKKSSN